MKTTTMFYPTVSIAFILKRVRIDVHSYEANVAKIREAIAKMVEDFPKSS